MAWGNLGTTTLSSTSSPVTVSGYTANEFSQELHHGIESGSYGSSLRFNNDSGSVYANGRSANGAAKNNSANRTFIENVYGDDTLMISYIVDIASEEKLIINFGGFAGADGSGNAPNRLKLVGKYVPSPTARITQVNRFDSEGGAHGIGTNLTVLGSELTPAAAVTALATNLQVGTRFEETDTRKMYNYTGISESELKAYYHFEDNGTNAQTTGDGLGSSANMTVTGATYATGKVGSKAISFDGTNDYTVIGSSTSDFNFLANTTHEWTVAFWFKNASWGSTEMILSTGNELSSSRFGLGIRAQSSGSIYVHFCNGTNQNRFTTTQTGFSTDGNWHFIVITAKKSDSTNSLEFWEDGTSLGTASNSGKDFVDTNASQAPYIGQAGDSSQWLSGQLDELSIWNRRLSDSEISTLYNSGTGKVIEIWQEIGA